MGGSRRACGWRICWRGFRWNGRGSRGVSGRYRKWHYSRLFPLSKRRSGDSVVAMSTTLDDLPAPCLILDDTKMMRNIARVGARLRVLPNHACATAAQHDRYHLLRDGAVLAEWPRFGGW